MPIFLKWFSLGDINTHQALSASNLLDLIAYLRARQLWGFFFSLSSSGKSPANIELIVFFVGLVKGLVNIYWLVHSNNCYFNFIIMGFNIVIDPSICMHYL